MKGISAIIFIGLPGVGKSTLAKRMRDCLRRDKKKTYIIERDKIRTNLLWDIRKAADISKQILHLDEKVNTEEINSISFYFDTMGADHVIFDGCHTSIPHLTNLLNFLKAKKIKTQIIFVGDENSQCRHKLSNHSEGDYSDYGEHGEHNTVPKEILEKKKKELKQIFVDFHQIFDYRDLVVVFPNLAPMPQQDLNELVETLQKNC